MDCLTASRSLEYGSSSVCADGGKAQRDDLVLEAKHKIFLSHSGAQKNFVEQLCLDIERRHRYPFFDKRRTSLRVGENVPEVIFQAIQQCEVGVVILSSEFFTRTKWPMLELAAMVKRREQNKEFMIMPVFLDITRDQCRVEETQRQWISKWTDWSRDDDRINIEDWKIALKVFGPTSALLYKESEGEVKLREEIVEAVCERVSSDTKLDDSHVEGRSRLCDLVREMIKEAKPLADGVRVVGLYGVGGIGKTTLCKALCNEFSKEFRDKVCHMELESRSEEELLREVLCSLTDSRQEYVAELKKDECLYRLKQDLPRQSVFLAIDNVVDNTRTIEQAQTYFKKLKYKEGSIIIVTARSRGQLQNFNIDVQHCHQMPELELDEARCLFLSNGSPELQSREEFVRRCVERCFFRKGVGSGGHYHPLALKVLGAQLGNDPEEWGERLEERDTFNQLREREHPVFSILGKSYDALKDEDKLLFMDVALFHPTCDKVCERRLNIFEWLRMVHGTSQSDVLKRLECLKRKSVLEDLGDGSRRIGIHDLWREFCVMEAKIERTESLCLYEKEESSRDRYRECSLHGGGWEHLLRVSIGLTREGRSQWTKCVNFGDCSNLTVLKLSDNHASGALVLDLTRVMHLKSLEVEFEVLCRCLGPCNELEIQGLGGLRDLRALILRIFPHYIGRCIEEIGSLANLEVLYLFSMGTLESVEFPDLSELVFLRQVAVEFFDSTVIVGLGKNTTRLEFLELRWWKKLRCCDWLGDLDGLVELDLGGCESLERVPKLGNVTKLQTLSIYDCSSITELPDLSKLINMRRFSICDCKSITELLGLESMVLLEQFAVCGCTNLAKLPDMSKLVNMDWFNISDCKSITEVSGLESMVCLQMFKAQRCLKLAKLPDMSKFINLKLLIISDCMSITEVRGLEYMVSLEKIEAEGCRNLAKLPDMSKLINMKRLVISNCVSITEVRGLEYMVGLEEFEADGCTNLAKLPYMCKVINMKKFIISNCMLITDVRGLDYRVSLDEYEAKYAWILQSCQIYPRL